MRLRSLNEAEVDVWPAFTDFVTSVLFIVVLFIFGLFFSNISRSLVAEDSSYREMQRRIRAVREALSQRVQGVVVPEADGSLQLIVLKVDEQGSGGVLFNTGEAVLQPAGEQRIDEIVEVLKQFRGSYKTIEVEGHADSDRLRNTTIYKSNWELSAARAGAVVNHILKSQAGLPPEAQLPPWLFSANGRGEYVPYDHKGPFSIEGAGGLDPARNNSPKLPNYVLGSNEDDTERRNNRRIEIRLTYSLAAQ